MTAIMTVSIVVGTGVTDPETATRHFASSARRIAVFDAITATMAKFYGKFDRFPTNSRNISANIVLMFYVPEFTVLANVEPWT